MPWVRFDDQFPIHRKVDVLSDAAFRLHVSAVCWCARNLTDGFIAAAELRSVSRARKPDKIAAELVRVGVWREVADGWQIHDYLDYQPSRQKVERERKAKAERQKRWSERRRRKVDASADASIDASKDDAPYPPRPEGSGAGEKRPRRGASGRTGPTGPAVRAVPPWCGQCDEHTRLLDPDRPRRCPTCHPLRDQEVS